jgi:DNA-binding phage protein
MKVKKRTIELAPFDASEFLDDEEVIAEYLAAALEDPNPDTFLRAVANVAKARAETVRKVLDSLGVKLTVAA